MDQLLWYLFAATRGGPNRLRIVELLYDRPYNAHQLAARAGLDYRTMLHHLKVLTRHHVLSNPTPDQYGSLYFLGGLVRSEWTTVVEIKRSIATTPPLASEPFPSSRKRAVPHVRSR